MSVDNKIEYLIVDTSAFIKNVPLQEVANNVITEQSVINEITNKRQLRRLVVLPYDLAIKDVFPENIKFVTEFSKKTGDYTSLSATDIKVIALTYQLEKEKQGKDHLKDAPSIVKTVPATKSEPLAHPKSIAGFYLGDDDEEEEEEEEESKDKNEEPKDKNEEIIHPENENQSSKIIAQLNEEFLHEKPEDEEEEAESKEKNEEEPEDKNEEVKIHPENENQSKIIAQLNEEFLHDKPEDKDNSKSSTDSDGDMSSDDSDDYLTANSNSEKKDHADLTAKFEKLNCAPDDLELVGGNEHNIDDILAPVKQDLHNDDDTLSDTDYEDEEDDEENDDDGWITPSNIAQAKKQMDSDIVSEKPAKVACMTTDFAMQNVLMQIGLNVAALDGRVIKQMRTFIFRCYACFKTTSVMTKIFCPHCGMKTLKKVAVSLDDEGNEQIHINFRKPLSARGKKFSLPMPKGGKHANNPILCEDQPRPDQRPSRLARMKNDPLNDDYIAGYSPFVTRDVYSKSAMLGIRSGKNGDFKYWMKRNPNESRRKRK